MFSQVLDEPGKNVEVASTRCATEPLINDVPLPGQTAFCSHDVDVQLPAWQQGHKTAPARPRPVVSTEGSNQMRFRIENLITLAVDPEEDDGQGGNPPTGDSDDGRQYVTW
ncbi:hypothetical protein ACIO6T_30720 [Streptomyces sp. NPDC087532]|uniref:hypothetical protein n=1 Tax=Streptomyces sp. NPDC087532 TaxID=3365795 RepID=UPI0037F999F4